MGKEICAVCGKIADEGVMLKDGTVICGECAAKVRILYPKSFTWLNVYVSDDSIGEYGSDEETGWADPLKDISLSEYREALVKAEEERTLRRARFPKSRACFRVDNIFRIIKKYPKGRKVITDEYAVTGMVLLGTVRESCEIRAARKEKTYTKAVKRLEVPVSDSMAMERASSIQEGCFGRLILDSDAPYIYPGDVLAVD